MSRQEITILLEKFIQGSLTPEETAMIGDLLKDRENSSYTREWIEHVLNEDRFESYTDFDVRHMFMEVMAAGNTSAAEYKISRRSISMRWLRYAAIVLLLAGAATFIYIANRPQKQLAQKQELPAIERRPGGNRAVLTLADGSIIVLDSVANGELAEQGNTRVLKTDAGSLAYNAGPSTGGVLYNTVSTPRGGQYLVALPDGSKVWLNAESSLRFPVSFNKDKRNVEITGEAYFEIASDKTRPFLVNTKEIRIEVLGTAFNVNTYQDEPVIRTTLLTGGIKLWAGNENVILNPGQQASVPVIKDIAGSTASGIQVAAADARESIAWKNGLFYFRSTPVRSVMNQLARWYNVEVEYAGNPGTEGITGKMSRDVPLSTVLEMLNYAGMKFRAANNKIILIN